MGLFDVGRSKQPAPKDEFLLSETPSEHSANKPGATTPPPAPRARKSFYTAWVDDWWLFEVLSVALGVVALLTICLVLSHYQNKPAPGLTISFDSGVGVGITLNTIIAILATVGRVSLLVAVAECIGQQKWLWFSGPAKRLTDFEVFDNGSRGAWGSVRLLWKIHVRQIVSIGALVLIIALAVDPLSQQLVRYELQEQPDPVGRAHVSTALQWATTDQETNIFNFGVGNNSQDLWPDPPLYTKAAVLNGMFASGIVINETQPYCATGNCTWPLYRSLAVCARWQDVSSFMKRTEFKDKNKNSLERWSLTDRNSIQTFASGDCWLNMSSAARPEPFDTGSTPSNAWDFSDSIAFKDNRYPLADVFLFYRDVKAQDRRFSAVEFVFEWCVQEFDTTVRKGTAFTTRLGSTNKFFGGNSDFLLGPGFNTTTEYRSLSGQPHYAVENKTHFILSNYLRKTLDGEVIQPGGEGDMMKSSDAAEAFYQRLNTRAANGTRQSNESFYGVLKEELQNIATSMTNVLREGHAIGSMSGNTNLTETFHKAHGTAWREQAFVRVQWGWIAAPVTLVLLSVIFVAVTIMQSTGQARRHMIWKSSTLSTLLALSEELHQRVGGLQSPSEIEDTLSSARAALRQDADGKWRLQDPSAS